jgi:plastocyanin
MKTIIGALFALSLALPVFASAATVNIAVGDDSFSPKNITVNQGDTIVWKNIGAMAHTVTADSGAFDSGNLAPGQSYSQTFSGVGTIAYYCKYHGGAGGVGMAGTVTVQAAASAAATPPPPPQTVTTSAGDNSSLQAQAQALLQQVAQLQAQLAAQNGGSSSAAPSGTVSTPASSGSNASCPNIGRILKRGSSGADVTRLQQFLAQDPSVYPEGTVSGYFGALTEKAVQRWQAKNNIISSGSPSTTGWGQVGPRTAAAIALLCSSGTTSPVGGYIQVSPVSGNAPLSVNVVATVNSTNSCAGAIYQLNWGDGANPISIPVSANNCQPLSQTYQHTYSNGGTYQITLSAGAHQTGATITVYGNSNTTGGGTTGSTSGTPAVQETFVATPTSGAAPLAVTFSGIVTGQDQGWCSSGCSDILVLGDGSQAAVPLPTSQNQSQSYSLQHTYANSGTYTATLYQGSAGSGRPTVGSPVTITVGGGTTSGGTTQNFQPPTVTPGVGGNPMAVSIGFDINSCGTYSINWGDSGSPTQGTAPCSGASTQSVQHTYAATGNYTITLTRNSQVSTAGVNIQ